MTVKPPPLLTEDTGKPPYTGCTFCTAVMMAGFGGVSLPLGVTTDEHYALVKAAGKQIGNEGATLADIQRGYWNRYGIQAHLFRGDITALKALGDVYALVQGVYADLPDHYRRWDPEFLGIHAAGYIPSLGWWQDPLATQRFIGAGFDGESMAQAVLAKYALGYGQSIHALYLKAGEFATGGGPVQPGGPMYNFSLRPGPGGSLVVKSDPAIRYLNLADGTLHAAAGMVKAIAWPITIKPPLGGGAPGADRSSGYLIGDDAAFVLASDVTFVPHPAPADCTSAVKAATDPLKAKIAAAQEALK